MRKCGHCGREFSGYGSQIYCTADCRRTAYARKESTGVRYRAWFSKPERIRTRRTTEAEHREMKDRMIRALGPQFRGVAPYGDDLARFGF